MIQTETTKIIYIGDGITTAFAIPFSYIDTTTVKVSIYEIATSVETALTKDYYVDSTANVVNYPGYAPGEEPPESERPPVLTNEYKLIIYRETPHTQLHDLGDKYPLPHIEEMSDKLTLVVQELVEAIDRAVKTGKGDTITPEELIEELRGYTAIARAWAQEETGTVPSYIGGAKSAKQWAGDAESSAEKAVDEVRDKIGVLVEKSSDGIWQYDNMLDLIPLQAPGVSKFWELDDSGELIPLDMEAVLGQYLTSAANSATAAALSETNASNSASAASTSETNAATSESNASKSANAAAISETNASNSASAAATSETSAAASATAADESAHTAADRVKQNVQDYVEAALVDTGDGTFCFDDFSDLMPCSYPVSSTKWDTDANGDIMPKEV